MFENLKSVAVPSYPFFTEAAFNEYADMLRGIPICDTPIVKNEPKDSHPPRNLRKPVGMSDRDVRRSRVSSLTAREQSFYLDLWHQYHLPSALQPTDEEIIERRHFQELERRVQQENAQFQECLEKAAQDNPKHHNYIERIAINYIKEKVGICKNRVRTYSPLYHDREEISLSPDTNPTSTPLPNVSLQFLATLHTQTDIPRIVRPVMSAPDKPCLKTIFSTMTTHCGGPKFDTEDCSSDGRCEHLAASHACHYAMSLSALTTLTNNCAPSFSHPWQLPVIVKLLPNPEGVPQKIIFIEKPLLNRPLSSRQKNEKFYNAAMKVFLKAGGSLKVPKIGSNKRQIEAVDSEKSDNDGESKMFGDLDFADVETFGASDYRKESLPRKFRSNKASAPCSFKPISFISERHIKKESVDLACEVDEAEDGEIVEVKTSGNMGDVDLQRNSGDVISETTFDNDESIHGNVKYDVEQPVVVGKLEPPAMDSLGNVPVTRRSLRCAIKKIGDSSSNVDLTDVKERVCSASEVNQVVSTEEDLTGKYRLRRKVTSVKSSSSLSGDTRDQDPVLKCGIQTRGWNKKLTDVANKNEIEKYITSADMDDKTTDSSGICAGISVVGTERRNRDDKAMIASGVVGDTSGILEGEATANKSRLRLEKSPVTSTNRDKQLKRDKIFTNTDKLSTNSGKQPTNSGKQSPKSPISLRIDTTSQDPRLPRLSRSAHGEGMDTSSDDDEGLVIDIPPCEDARLMVTRSRSNQTLAGSPISPMPSDRPPSDCSTVSSPARSSLRRSARRSLQSSQPPPSSPPSSPPCSPPCSPPQSPDVADIDGSNVTAAPIKIIPLSWSSSDCEAEDNGNAKEINGLLADTGDSSRGVETRSQDVESRSEESESVSWQLEGGSHEVKSRSRKMEIRSPEVESGSQKVEKRSLEFGKRTGETKTRHGIAEKGYKCMEDASYPAGNTADPMDITPGRKDIGMLPYDGNVFNSKEDKSESVRRKDPQIGESVVEKTSRSGPVSTLDAIMSLQKQTFRKPAAKKKKVPTATLR